MKKKKLHTPCKVIAMLTIAFTLNSIPLYGQKNYIDASNVKGNPILTGHLKMGNAGPVGKEIELNSWYMSIGKKPVIPVMGELQFSRTPKEKWEELLQKMKANGVNIIATYVFWNHIEEIEGQFDWNENKNLRDFAKLCQKHGLFLYPRIGPWCHGEARNGGTPDWIIEKIHIQDRSNNAVYQSYVSRFFKEIGKQLQGLYYKDGGPVIGIQFENEYCQLKEGETHILWLKQTAQSSGMDVPIYSVTGWGGASVPQDEVIPLFGSYPESPWDANLNKSNNTVSYVFWEDRDNPNIGNDLKQKGNYTVDLRRYPFFTCELGTGNQKTYHRRNIFSPIDGAAIALSKLGSGSNLLGYYVFVSGLNPIGELSTMEEEKDFTGYWSQVPQVTYNFGAPISETGELSPAYHQLKKFHYFLNEFGDRLALTHPVFRPNQNYEKDLLYSVRVNNNSGFLFVSNYLRGIQKPEQKNVQFTIKLKNETLVFPSVPIAVSDSSFFIWPFNFDMTGITLKYATVQPMCKIEEKNIVRWFFSQSDNIGCELSFDASNIAQLSATSGKITLKNNLYVISGLLSGIKEHISIQTKDGKSHEVIILSPKETLQSWLLHDGNKKQLFLSDATLLLKENKLTILDTSSVSSIIKLSNSENIILNENKYSESTIDGFKKYVIPHSKKNFDFHLKQSYPLDDVAWLNAGFKRDGYTNELFTRTFIKEFNLGNSAPIRSAKMILYAGTGCRIRINKLWVNQPIKPDSINVIDVTGYVNKGNNVVLICVQGATEGSVMASKIIIEYNNADEVQISTDESWLTYVDYIIPSVIKQEGIKLSPPEKVKAPETYIPSNIQGIWSEYKLTVPNNYMDSLNDVYLHIDYAGDIARARYQYRLYSDDFFNTEDWHLSLVNFNTNMEGQTFKIQIKSLNPDYKILFDKKIEKQNIGKAIIHSIRVVPKYKTILEISKD